MGCGGSRSSAGIAANPTKVAPAPIEQAQATGTPQVDTIPTTIVAVVEPVSGKLSGERRMSQSHLNEQLSGSKLLEKKELVAEPKLHDMLATQPVQIEPQQDLANMKGSISQEQPEEVEARRHSQVLVELVGNKKDSDSRDRLQSGDNISPTSERSRLEAHLNDTGAFVPATNIQYEIPEAFKHKEPLVPVGLYSIEALETVQPESEFSNFESVVAATSEHTEGDFLMIVGLEKDTQHTKYVGVGADGKPCFKHTEKETRYNHLYHQGREFVAERGGGLVIQDDEATVLEYKPKPAPGNCQFVDEYLFYLDEVSRVIRVEFEDEIPTVQRVISGPFQGEDEGAIEKLQVSPAQRLFNLCDGRLRDGVDLNPKDERKYGRLVEYEVTHSVTLNDADVEDYVLKTFNKIEREQLVAVAESEVSNKFGYCLYSPSLELLHMTIFTLPKRAAGEYYDLERFQLKEWRGAKCRLIISAREIFEIDLLLIGGNDDTLVPLQTFCPDDKSHIPVDCLVEAGNRWIVGGGSTLCSILWRN